MYIKEKINVIENKIKVYVSNDGTEFKTEEECLRHERQTDFYSRFKECIVCDVIDHIRPFQKYRIVSKDDYLAVQLHYVNDIRCRWISSLTIEEEMLPFNMFVQMTDYGDYNNVAFVYTENELEQYALDRIENYNNFIKDIKEV